MIPRTTSLRSLCLSQRVDGYSRATPSTLTHQASEFLFISICSDTGTLSVHYRYSKSPPSPVIPPYGGEHTDCIPPVLLLLFLHALGGKGSAPTIHQIRLD